MQSALIIDDDVELCSILRQYLAMHDIELSMEHDGVTGLEAVRRREWDIVLLDIMLPRLNGFELLARIRSGSRANVLLLTTLRDEGDRITGLESGADDYLPKPFNPRELVARIRAVVRRDRWRQTPERALEAFAPRTAPGLRVDPVTRSICYNNRALPLTDVEFALLRAFLEAPGLVLSREELMTRILQKPFHPLDRSVDMHISRLRRKLNIVQGVDNPIKAIRSSGYLFSLESAS